MTKLTIRFSPRLFRLVVMVLWAWLIPGLVLAQTAGGTGGTPTAPTGRGGAISHSIRGKVFLPSGGMPDQRIRVVLELTSGGVAGEVFTDSGGNFEFRSLPNGTYRIVVPSDNQLYETTMETVELFGSFSRSFFAQVTLKNKDEGLSIRPKEKLISVADFQEVPKEAKKFYEKGLKRAQENKAAEAMKLFQDALKIFPDYLLAINKLGEQHMFLNQPEDARAQFERALSLNAKFVLPRINLGILYVGQKQFAEGIRELEAGCRMDDSYPMAHLNLGVAFMSQEPPDIERAEKEMTRAIALGGRNFAYARKLLFNWYIRRNDLAKAGLHLENYLKEAGGDAPDADQVRQVLAKVKSAQKK